MLHTKLQVDWPFGSEGEAKNRFPIGTILAILIYQIIPMPPAKFQVSWPFGSGEEMKHRFSRWAPGRPSWISDRNDFS